MALRELEELHLVTTGESLESIARNQWLDPVTPDDLLRANPQLLPFPRVSPGDVIVIPRVYQSREPLGPYWSLSWREVNHVSRQFSYEERELFHRKRYEIVTMGEILEILRNDSAMIKTTAASSMLDAKNEIQKNVAKAIAEFDDGIRAISKDAAAGAITENQAKNRLAYLRRTVNAKLKPQVATTLRHVLDESRRDSRLLGRFTRGFTRTTPAQYAKALKHFQSTASLLKKGNWVTMAAEPAAAACECAGDYQFDRNMRGCVKGAGASLVGLGGGAFGTVVGAGLAGTIGVKLIAGSAFSPLFPFVVIAVVGAVGGYAGAKTGDWLGGKIYDWLAEENDGRSR